MFVTFTATLLSWLKKPLLWLIMIPLILLIGWYSWSWYTTTTQTTTPPQTAQVTTGDLVVTVTAAGQVSATNSRTATTNVSGVVKRVLIQNNQLVKTGQTLVEIELDQEAKQTYTQAQASYQSAKNALAAAQANMYSLQATMLGKWDSYKELAENDTYKDTASANRSLPEFHIPQKEWLAAEAQYKNQQAVVAQAQTALNNAAQTLKLSSPLITAPISGRVTGQSLLPGAVISPTTANNDSSTTGQTVASILTDTQMTIAVNLTEIDVTKVELNDLVSITIDALPEKTYKGHVMSIDQVGSVSSGVTSYPAVIVLDNSAPEILAHMSAQASIVTDKKEQVVVVPASAVHTQNGQTTVTKMVDGQSQTVSVTTGLASATSVEIVSGLRVGDTIVTSTATKTTTSSTTTSPFSGLGGPGGLGSGTRAR